MSLSNTKKVSIIIPFYNLGKYLEEAIISCINQTYKNIEIIVVNDGTTDQFSISKLNNLKKIYSKKVLFVDQTNHGLSVTRNNGIKLATGEFICCLDADDMIAPKYIEESIKLFTSKEIAFVTSYAKFFGKENLIWKTSDYDPIKLLVDNVVHVASVFRKDSWIRAGGYNERFTRGYEDWNFWIKIVSQGYKWKLLPKPLFFYRRRTNSMVSKSNKMRANLIQDIITDNKDFYIKNIYEIVKTTDNRFYEKTKEITKLDETIKLLLKHINELNQTDKTLLEEISTEKMKQKKYKNINYTQLNKTKNKLRQKITQIVSLENQIDILSSENNKFKNSKYYKLLILKYKTIQKIKSLLKKPQLLLRQVNFISTQKTNKKLPLISVVTPVYNRTKELRESINSILNQTHNNLELILVTDGSPKDTLKIVNNYAHDPRVKVFHYFKQSGNAIRGRNKGIKEATGEYIAFQDSDDISEPNRLEKSLEYMNKYKVDLVYGAWKALVDGTRKDTGIENGQIVTSPESDLKSMKKACIPCQSTVMVKRSALIDVGGLNQSVKYHEDHELWLRLLHFGYRFKSIPEPLIQLRLHAGNNELNFKKDDKKWHEMALESYTKKRNLFKKIAYLLPGTGIGGGVAVVCEHANRLLSLGYDLLIITEGEIKDLSWFPGQSVNTVSVNDKDQLKNIDILIMTGWSTAYSGQSINAKRKIYFVQSDERRFFPSDKEYIKKVNKTYQMNYEFMTEAKWIKKWLKDEFGKNASYVPNGVNTEIFYQTKPLEPKPKDKFRVLLEGPIDIPFKGMADAFKSVQDSDCEVWCISSAGKPKKEWRCDKFFEKVPMAEMKTIYSSCDILIKMSRVEGFFGPPLEMMACGGIPIVSKVTGHDEYIVNGHNALVVEPGDSEKIKVLIKKLMTRKSTMYKKLLIGSQKTYPKWSWSKSIKKLTKIINS